MIDDAHLVRGIMSVLGHVEPVWSPSFVPSTEALADVVKKVFWSTLADYEGTPTRVRVLLAPPGLELRGALKLAAPLPLNDGLLRRLAPVHGRRGALIASVDDRDVRVSAIFVPEVSKYGPPRLICIEGTGRGCLRVATSVPPHGHTLAEFVRGELRFAGGMTFDRTVVSMLVACGLVRSWPPDSFRAHRVADMYFEIARTIERSGQGGALWLIPKESDVSSFADKGYAVAQPPDWHAPFAEEWEMRTSVIRMLNPHVTDDQERLGEIQSMAQHWDQARRATVAAGVAALARTDGAILANDSPTVLRFGVIHNTLPSTVTEAFEPRTPGRPMEPGQRIARDQLGGSRHQSAADFCRSFAPASAIVASHDGGITVFASSDATNGAVMRVRVATMQSTHWPAATEDTSLR